MLVPISSCSRQAAARCQLLHHAKPMHPLCAVPHLPRLPSYRTVLVPIPAPPSACESLYHAPADLQHCSSHPDRMHPPADSKLRPSCPRRAGSRRCSACARCSPQPARSPCLKRATPQPPGGTPQPPLHQARHSPTPTGHHLMPRTPMGQPPEACPGRPARQHWTFWADTPQTCPLSAPSTPRGYPDSPKITPSTPKGTLSIPITSQPVPSPPCGP